MVHMHPPKRVPLPKLMHHWTMEPILTKWLCGVRHLVLPYFDLWSSATISVPMLVPP